MSGVLLDTHVLVWALFDDPRLSARARATIQAADQAYVSVASLYEIDFKRHRPGRADTLLQRLPDDLPETLSAAGYVLAAIDASVARSAARLPIDHGDPWDRILLAQALSLGVPLISADRDLTLLAQGHPGTTGVITF